jgi:hypothetical protein
MRFGEPDNLELSSKPVSSVTFIYLPHGFVDFDALEVREATEDGVSDLLDLLARGTRKLLTPPVSK